jgi:hypothetical protein
MTRIGGEHFSVPLAKTRSLLLWGCHVGQIVLIIWILAGAILVLFSNHFLNVSCLIQHLPDDLASVVESPKVFR